MDKYSIFLEKHKTLASKEEQMLLLKNFMLSLSPTELKEWLLNDDDENMVDTLRDLVSKHGEEGRKHAKQYISEIKDILKDIPLNVSKAA
jgi:hypothetical protein